MLTQPEIVERDVVIARHRQPGRLEPVKESPGIAVLAVARALGEIAGDRHEIRPRGVHGIDQRVEQLDIGAAEMQVRDMNDAGHSVLRAPGTMTFSGASRRRTRIGVFIMAFSPSRATSVRLWPVWMVMSRAI